MKIRNLTLALLFMMSLTLTACSWTVDDGGSLLEADETIEESESETDVIKEKEVRVIFPKNVFSRNLEDHDLRIAYEGATTAVSLNKLNPFANYDKVMPLLSDLIELTGIRNVYLISHNNNLHNITRNFCVKYGYVFNGSTNAAVALQELHFSPGRDLILLDSGLKVTDSKGRNTSSYFSQTVFENTDPKANRGTEAPAGLAWPPLIKSRVNDHKHPIEALFAREVFLWLKKDVRTNSIPVAMLTLAESDEHEVGIETAKEIYGNKPVEYLIKPLTEDPLRELAQRLFHSETERNWKDAKLESEKLVITACKVISKLEGKQTIFDVRLVYKALIEGLKEPKEDDISARPPHLRAEVIKCAAAVNNQEAFQYMMAVAANTNNTVPLRQSAIDAMGKLIGKNRREVPKGNSYEDVITLMSSLLAEETDAIWESAAFSLGQLKTSEKTRTQLAVFHRINKQRKE